MRDVLNNAYTSLFDKVIIIDCRFDYEFNGGHIPNALNFQSTIAMTDYLFQKITPATLIVFHCEFSIQRAPRMYFIILYYHKLDTSKNRASFLRNQDRNMNAANYPQLHFPNLYVLNGGYKAFFELYSQNCIPCNFVPMNDPNFSIQCKSDMAKHDRQFKKGGK